MLVVVVVVVADKLKVFPVCLLNEKVKSAASGEEGKTAGKLGGCGSKWRETWWWRCVYENSIQLGGRRSLHARHCGRWSSWKSRCHFLCKCSDLYNPIEGGSGRGGMEATQREMRCRRMHDKKHTHTQNTHDATWTNQRPNKVPQSGGCDHNGTAAVQHSGTQVVENANKNEEKVLINHRLHCLRSYTHIQRYMYL